ncbi:MAG: hypothetical protein H7287_08830, partial [Thermoleophilia bacterium]|nr:hypothetical protein [Thermoleophilia bacterium]
MKAPGIIRTIPIETRIARAMVDGFPIVTRRSMRAAGMHRSAVARRIADGRLVELFPNVFLVGIREQHATSDVRIAAAVAMTGPRSALDGVSALHRLDCWNRHDGTIRVATTSGSATKVVGVRFCRVRPEQIRMQVVSGIPTRRALDALFVAARELTPHQLAFVIDRARYRRLMSLDDIEHALVVSPGRPGSVVVRRGLELVRGGSAGTKSRSEDTLLAELIDLVGIPLVNVRGSAGLVGYEPDFCYQALRLIIEVDGDQHTDDPHQA